VDKNSNKRHKQQKKTEKNSMSGPYYHYGLNTAQADRDMTPMGYMLADTRYVQHRSPVGVPVFEPVSGRGIYNIFENQVMAREIQPQASHRSLCREGSSVTSNANLGFTHCNGMSRSAQISIMGITLTQHVAGLPMSNTEMVTYTHSGMTTIRPNSRFGFRQGDTVLAELPFYDNVKKQLLINKQTGLTSVSDGIPLQLVPADRFNTADHREANCAAFDRIDEFLAYENKQQVEKRGSYRQSGGAFLSNASELLTEFKDQCRESNSDHLVIFPGEEEDDDIGMKKVPLLAWLLTSTNNLNEDAYTAVNKLTYARFQHMVMDFCLQLQDEVVRTRRRDVFGLYVTAMTAVQYLLQLSEDRSKTTLMTSFGFAHMMRSSLEVCNRMSRFQYDNVLGTVLKDTQPGQPLDVLLR
jgi:hypothetical protein